MRSMLELRKTSVVVAMANKLAHVDMGCAVSSGEDYRPNNSMVTAS